MKTINKSLFFLTFIFLIGIKSIGQTKFLVENQFKDFIPISEIEFDTPVVIAENIRVFDTLTIKELSTNKLKLQYFLNDFSTYVTIQKVNSSGTIEYAVSSATVEKGSYTVIIDFIKCNTVNLTVSDGSCGGYGKVGVGIRLKANIETKKDGLNIGNLFGLALAAQSEKVTGTLSVDIIGIESRDVMNLIPIPSEISTSAITNTLQAISTIKSKIENQETRLHPKLMAIKLTGNGGCDVNGLIKKISEDESAKQKQQK